jgi:uncharacterized protein YhbP (UPF0306 family)
MSKLIDNFIQKQTCASVCCIDDKGNPYCFTCFYAYDEENKILFFKSGEESYHAQLMQKHRMVAATILPNKLNTLRVQGIQLEGIILEDSNSLLETGNLFYHQKHPLAIAVKGKIWGLQINHIKMTDSSWGFGKK